MANDWIEHDGGPRPVPGDTLVRIKSRNGEEDQDKATTYEWRWIAGRPDWQLTHYRVI